MLCVRVIWSGFDDDSNDKLRDTFGESEFFGWFTLEMSLVRAETW